MPARFLTALPVYNEQQHVAGVLDQVVCYSQDVLVVDDGSTDQTAELLAGRDDILVATHERNLGYGAALRTAFLLAIQRGYDVLVTIDCDGQHQPQRIPEFVAACWGENGGQPITDIVSGSRYLERFPGDVAPPEERRRINMQITDLLNRRLGLRLTDAFCGFKAYRVASLPSLLTCESGYAMPLELWARAAAGGLRIVELPVPLIYLEEKRSFGGELDDGGTRLAYYHQVLDASLARIDAESRGDEHGDDYKMVCGKGAG